MKALFLTLIMVISASVALGKIDWKVCEKDLKEFCTTVKDDHEKHECLEEAPQGQVSKACHDFNAKLESQFADKHKHGKKHDH